jgi:hypothetical protein
VKAAGVRIGVLAEDETDCNALREIVVRIGHEVKAPAFGVERDWGDGCANLRRKARPMMRQMAAKGCTAIVFVHDLDLDPANGERNEEGVLRAKLEAIEVPPGVRRLICIPVEELEAWFWSDQALLDKLTGGKAKAVRSPDRVKKPKESLSRASAGANKKPRYSTNDSKELAKVLNFDVCAQRCRSFRELREFVRSAVAPGPGWRGFVVRHDRPAGARDRRALAARARTRARAARGPVR